MDINKVKANMEVKNHWLSNLACKDSEAIRFEEQREDFRTPFFRDIDRIVYSLSYTRYMDKTQVFSFNDNDNISKRMTHVQMVSKVARTIGRALRLNEDLIEAAALGHDLGHVPFGHVGEKILNDISLEYHQGHFNHNIQSVRTLMTLENNGKGSNITLQVLDAIMCHNGEMELEEYKPCSKSKEKFLEEYKLAYEKQEIISKMVPMTLEGCVVRISDIIAYVGRDIEDAIRMNLISIDEIPKDITNVLGVKNSEIINTIINDLISNSLDHNYLKLSEKVFNALKCLKKFNYEHIYAKANNEDKIKYYEQVFRSVFTNCLNDLKTQNKKGHIYTVFLDYMDESYLKETCDERKVIDYIAGMTDDFIIAEYNSKVAM